MIHVQEQFYNHYFVWHLTSNFETRKIESFVSTIPNNNGNSGKTVRQLLYKAVNDVFYLFYCFSITYFHTCKDKII